MDIPFWIVAIGVALSGAIHVWNAVRLARFESEDRPRIRRATAAIDQEVVPILHEWRQKVAEAEAQLEAYEDDPDYDRSEIARHAAEARWEKEHEETAKKKGIENALKVELGADGVELVKELAGDDWDWALDHPMVAQHVLGPVIAKVKALKDDLEAQGKGMGLGGLSFGGGNGVHY